MCIAYPSAYPWMPHVVSSFLSSLWLEVIMYIYQEEWDATIGEILHCQRETVNHHDPYAVATPSDRTVVGYVPRKILPICSIFI